MGDLANGRGEAVVDDEEVVVGVEREFVRIEGAFANGSRGEELFREQAGGGEKEG